MNRNKGIILVIGIALLLLGGWLGLRTFLEVDNPFYIVSSGSMVPNLMVGDGVIIQKSYGHSFGDVAIGDIIVFRAIDDKGMDHTIIHRIVEIYFSDEEEENVDRILKTKGDANPQSYEGMDYPIFEEDYYGKVILAIPKIGALRYLGS